MIKDLALKRGEQTVFRLIDIAQLTGRPVDHNLSSAVSYYVKKRELVRLSKGLYALDGHYSKWELGNKLRVPSYVSLYSVLQIEGVVFQPYNSVFLISNRSEKVEIQGQQYVYRKIKDEILLNPAGITVKDNVAVASVERAFLDKLYLDGEEHFDNLSMIDWQTARQLNEQVYKNQLIARYIETIT